MQSARRTTLDEEEKAAHLEHDYIETLQQQVRYLELELAYSKQVPQSSTAVPSGRARRPEAAQSGTGGGTTNSGLAARPGSARPGGPGLSGASGAAPKAPGAVTKTSGTAPKASVGGRLRALEAEATMLRGENARLRAGAPVHPSAGAGAGARGGSVAAEARVLQEELALMTEARNKYIEREASAREELAEARVAGARLAAALEESERGRAAATARAVHAEAAAAAAMSDAAVAREVFSRSAAALPGGSFPGVAVWLGA